MKNSIGIIDYGMGNLHSAHKALEKVAPDSRVFLSDDADQLAEADRLVLPGVGAIGHCIEALAERGLDELVRSIAGEKPLLGICVGMQLLFERSEENGGIDCLGLVAGTVKRFPDMPGLKVPHMGWNTVDQREHPLWNNIADRERFYFVHSYYCTPHDVIQSAGITVHGVPACAAVIGEKLFAVQFHPEKSHNAGLQLLANFAHWDGASYLPAPPNRKYTG